MISLLFANWKSILAVAVTLSVCFFLHSIRVDWIEVRHEKEILSLKDDMKKQCKSEKAITKEVSYEYQTKLADLRKRIDAARRLHKLSCIAITSDTAARHDDGAAQGEHSGQGVSGNRSISSESLITFLGEGDKYRLQLMSCQTFIERTWEAIDNR